MGFRFRKSVKVFPGVRLNISGSGVSASVGRPGATVNFSKRGYTTTLGLPGTGLSYSTHTPWQGRRGAPASPARPATVLPDRSAGAGREAATPSPPMTDLGSAETALLTSGDLAGVKEMLVEAEAQRRELEAEFVKACAARERAWRRLRKCELPPLGWIGGRALPRLRAAFTLGETVATQVAAALAASKVHLEFAADARVLDAYRRLEVAFDAIRASSVVWDVTATAGIDPLGSGRIVSSRLRRVPVVVSLLFDGLVRTTQAGLRFGNANGGDIEIFPGVLIIRARFGGDFALVDLRQVTLKGADVAVIEADEVPPRATVQGAAWEKENSSGGPDRRFRGNRQLPVCGYGTLKFSTQDGMNEAYMVAEAGKVMPFVRAWDDLKASLHAGSPGGSPRNLQEAPVSGEPPGLPPLGEVRGAWSAAFALAGLAVGGLAFLGSGDDARSTLPERPLARSGGDLPSAATRPGVPALPALSSPDARQAPAGPAGTQAVRPAMAAVPLKPPDAGGERVRVLRAANVRSRPDRGAAVVLVEAAGARLEVFSREGDWVQVGVGDPRGWIHRSLLDTAR